MTNGLLCCVGNDFCGTVPAAFTGARQTEGLTANGQQLLLNVTAFNKTCPGVGHGSSDKLSTGAIAGKL